MSTLSGQSSPVAAWTPWFREMSPALKALLEPWWQSLGQLLGDAPRRAAATASPQMGLGDVHARGELHRLLGTDWLLLEAEPDEFMRRLLQHELLFLAPERKRSPEVRPVMLLLDASPWMWGQPKVAQWLIAALLSLKARAQGGELWLAWSSHPGHWLRMDDDQQILRALKGRADRLGQLFDPDPEAAWAEGRRQLAAGEPQALRDVERWWVGHRHLAGQEVHSVRVQPLLEDGGLALSWRPVRQASRDWHLPALSSEAVGQVLSGRWEEGTSSRSEGIRFAISTSRAPVWSPHSPHLALMLADDAASVVVTLPDASKPGKVPRQNFTRREWPRHGETLALCAHGRTHVALRWERVADDQAQASQAQAESETEEARLALRGAQTHAWSMERSALASFRHVPGLRKWRHSAWVQGPRHEHWLMVDDGYVLHAWSRTGKEKPVHQVMQPGVLALIPCGGNQLVLLMRVSTPNGIAFNLTRFEMGPGGWRALASSPLGRAGASTDGLRAFLHHTGPVGSGTVVALQPDSGHSRTWILLGKAEEGAGQEVTLTPSERAMGVLTSAQGEPRLLVLGKDDRTLSLVGAGSRSVAYRSPQPVAQVSIHPNLSRCCLVTYTGRLIVLTLEPTAVILDLEPRQPARQASAPDDLGSGDQPAASPAQQATPPDRN